jgi:fructoselysine 6-kinase
MHRVEGETAHNQIFNDELGERYGIDDAWAGGVYEQFRMDEADWTFASQFEVWSTHANSPCYEDALQRKKEEQLMAVDFLHWQEYEKLERSLAVIDIAYFGGTAVMADTLAKIARQHNGLIVLTLGAAGSIAFAGDEIFTQTALPLAKVVDTTGCGDAFQAGFTANFYHTRDIQTALLAGAEAGRQAATHFGGVPC